MAQDMRLTVRLSLEAWRGTKRAGMFVRRFRDRRSQCPTYKLSRSFTKPRFENLRYLNLRKDKQNETDIPLSSVGLFSSCFHLLCRGRKR